MYYDTTLCCKIRARPPNTNTASILCLLGVEITRQKLGFFEVLSSHYSLHSRIKIPPPHYRGAGVSDTQKVHEKMP